MDTVELHPDHIIEALEATLDIARQLNQEEAYRCRELSLAITKMEEALHWFKAAPRQ